MKFRFYSILAILFFGLTTIPAFANKDLAAELSGRILLQVEENGEAWYVRTDSNQRMFLGRAEDAHRIMSAVGVGILDQDLARIEIDTKSLFSTQLVPSDQDNDLIHDEHEAFFQTDMNLSDTDNDGFNDYTEIINGYNPNGLGKMQFDMDFTKSVAGKILLQVERNGEAWYVDPVTLKRYFLGKPANAFMLMQERGLGISNADLEQIPLSAPSLLDKDQTVSDISGSVNLIKTAYTVGEPFLGGSVELRYNGAPFQAFVVQGIQKNDGPTIYHIGIKGLFEELDFEAGKKKNFSALQPLQAFDIKEEGYMLYNEFKEAGEYHYILEVYDCSAIETLHNINCESVSLNNLSPFTPVFRETNSVFVSN